jgi:hypothetical protein
MMLDFFKDIGKLVDGLGSHKGALEANIQAVKDEKNLLQTAPLHKADVIEYYDNLIDQAAGQFDAGLQCSINRLSHDPMHLENTHGVKVITNPLGNGPLVGDVEIALLALFRDDIKASLRKRIEALPERNVLLEKAEKKLAGLEKELAELRLQAAKHGVLI